MDTLCSLSGTVLDVEVLFESSVWLHANLVVCPFIACSPGQNSPLDFVFMIGTYASLIYLFILISGMFAKCMEADINAEWIAMNWKVRGKQEHCWRCVNAEHCCMGQESYLIVKWYHLVMVVLV